MKKIIGFLFLLLISVINTFCQVPKPMLDTYVDDYANVLSKDQILSLNKSIRTIEDSFSVQIAVILVNKLPDNMVIEDYAREIGRQWHVGNAQNGLVYVVSISEHKQRLEVAKRLESSIDDITASQILATMKVPLKEKDYNSAMVDLVAQIKYKLKPVQAEQKALGDAELKKKEDDGYSGIWVLLSILLCIAAFIVVVYFIIRDKPEDEEAVQDELPDEVVYKGEKHLPEPIYTPPLRHIDGRGHKKKHGLHRTGKLIPLPIPIRHSGIDNSSKSADRPGMGGTTIIPIPIIIPSSNNDDDTSSSSSSSSSSSNDDSFGNWGSGSSDSGSSDTGSSGFDGGGASSDF